MPFGTHVLIEFTKETKLRAVGDRLRVDSASAASLVDDLKVAKRVGDKPVKSRAKNPVVEAPDVSADDDITA
jgi:hypothetical protein